MAEITDLRAPFTYFGGKSRIAEQIWDAIGDPYTYIEPFCGSAAALLARPAHHQPEMKREIINDASGYVVNAWRAIQRAPDDLGARLEADATLFELDLHARDAHLLHVCDDITEKLRTDPKYYDLVAAAYWISGVSGTPCGRYPDGTKSPPDCHSHSRGVHSLGARFQIPEIINRLSTRLRFVRILCGDWNRVVASRTMTGPNDNDICGVLLDPPYASSSQGLYAGLDSPDPAYQAYQWALEHGDNPRFRIVLCGYDGDYPHIPDTWRTIEWGSGYSSYDSPERLYLSPYCLGAGSYHGMDITSDAPDPRLIEIDFQTLFGGSP